MSGQWKPNPTVAAIVERAGRFLLVEEETDEGLRLNQPAGHLERGESLVAACARETLEETAWHFVPTALVGIYLWPRPQGDILAAGPRPAGSPLGGPQGEAAMACDPEGSEGEPSSPPSVAGPPEEVGRGSGRRSSITYLRFAFCGELGAHEDSRVLDAGILRALWLTPAEIEAARERHRSPLIMQCLADYHAGRRFPLELIRHYP